MNSESPKPLRVGLTGGIASGKSTVTDMFAGLGVPVIDTDVIAREVVEPGQPALEDIHQRFGQSAISKDGTLNRAAMRKFVFADDDARKALEDILHPRIREVVRQRADLAGGDYQLIVVPLLVESPMKREMDRILVVDCDEQTQISRLLARDAETEEQARRMIAAQASRDERLAIADEVIRNDGGLAETRKQVENMHRHYLELSAIGDS